MASRIQSSINLGWHTLVLLSTCYHSFGVKASIPVSPVENGFMPSRIWLQGSFNDTDIHKDESKILEERKISLIRQAPQPAAPQMPSPQASWSMQVQSGNHWAPSMLPVSSSPPPPPLPPLLVNITISQQTEGFVILCQVQEPLEHISWIWFACPNNISPSDGTVIASGTIVSNATLYTVRIMGQLGFYISELTILQNPLQSGTAGLYRCDAWLHGQAQNTDSIYHDDFIIGGQDMLNTCFTNNVPTNNGNNGNNGYYYSQYTPSVHSRKTKKSFRTPRNDSLLGKEGNHITEEEVV